MNIAKEIIEFNAPILVADLNKTCTYGTRVPDINSVRVYTNNILRCPTKDNLRDIRIYTAEYLKDWLSDDKIGSIKPAVCKILFRNLTKANFEKAEIDFLRRYETPYIKNFLELFKNSSEKTKKTIMVTRHVFPKPSVRYFGFDDHVSNDSIFDEKGRFIGFDISIRSGEDKLRATEKKLREYGSTLKECIVIADGVSDIPLVENAGMTIASPLAAPKIAKLSNYKINGKYGFMTLVKEFQQEMQSKQ